LRTLNRRGGEILVSTFTTLVVLAASSCAFPMLARAQDQSADSMENADVAAPGFEVSFIWLDRKLEPQELSNIINQFARAANLPESFNTACDESDETHVSCYPNLGGFALPLPLEQTMQIARKIGELKVAADGAAGSAIRIRRIEPNEVIRGFVDQCHEDTAEPWPENDQTEPASVKGIGGPAETVPEDVTVWVVDSGISDSFDQTDLNVIRAGFSRECKVNKNKAAVCQPKDANQDRFGHGTMIAGIIGAKDDGAGLVGVAPGVRLVPIQIFRRSPTTDLRVVYKALDYLEDAAVEGDVINISWGMDWNPTPAVALPTPQEPPNERNIELVLRAFSTTRKISVAAGNISALTNRSGYVQTVSPALVEEVVTVSAAGVPAEDGTWTKRFWPDSAFGNGRCENGYPCAGPPDFAAPGENVLSLWPGNKINTCSGTSFSAAHVSGILAVGDPRVEDTERAEGDPSAIYFDGNVQKVDDALRDPLALLP
jgi:hypothetical protein